MFKHMIRWIVPVVVLLLIVTVLVLSPAFSTFAAGGKYTKPSHTISADGSTPTPTPTPDGGGMTPNIFWHH
jgi:hypothetical protein